MPATWRTALIRVALAAAVALALGGRASADPIVLSDVQVAVDPVSLVATLTAGLAAQENVFLDALSVDLSQHGVPIADLFAGPILLDVQPFFDLPVSLLAGELLPAGTTLFRLTGLLPDETYAGSFSLLQFAPGAAPVLATQTFAFTTTPASVPEPATVLLIAGGLGVTGWFERRRRRASLHREP